LLSTIMINDFLWQKQITHLKLNIATEFKVFKRDGKMRKEIYAKKGVQSFSPPIFVSFLTMEAVPIITVICRTYL